MAVRSSADPDTSARLGHEAKILTRVAGRGVVSLVDHTEGPPAVLRTVFVGPDSWQDRPPTGPSVAPALAALGATLARLHTAGVTHRRIDPSHVLVDADDLPVLCGFGEAGPCDSAGAAADIAAFAGVGRALATDCDHDLEAILDGLEAGHTDLHAAVAALGRRRLPSAGAAPRRVPRAVPSKLAAVSGAVALAVTGLAAVALRSDDPAAVGGPAAGPVDDSPLIDATGAAPATEEPPGAVDDVAGSGSEATGPELVHGARRYAVGRPGDLVTVGDWNCDGTATPAVLRPETGEVAVFDRWPSPGASINPSFRAVVDRPVDLVPGPGDCPELRVATETGSRLILTPES